MFTPNFKKVQSLGHHDSHLVLCNEIREASENEGSETTKIRSQGSPAIGNQILIDSRHRALYP